MLLGLSPRREKGLQSGTEGVPPSSIDVTSRKGACPLNKTVRAPSLWVRKYAPISIRGIKCPYLRGCPAGRGSPWVRECQPFWIVGVHLTTRREVPPLPTLGSRGAFHLEKKNTSLFPFG